MSEDVDRAITSIFIGGIHGGLCLLYLSLFTDGPTWFTRGLSIGVMVVVNAFYNKANVKK